MDARVNDDPASEVAEAPPGCFYLVMSHSHALDFALCEIFCPAATRRILA